MSALALGFQAGSASTVKVCGTVYLPGAASLSPGEITVSLTRERVYLIGTDTDTKSVSLGGSTTSYCLEHNNDFSSLINYHKYRIKVSKNSSPTEDIFSGNLELKHQDGTVSEKVVPDRDYQIQLDVKYLGAADPLPTKLSFLGLQEYRNSSDGQSLISRQNTASASNKTVVQSFSNGNYVANFSFENDYANWRTGMTEVQVLSLKATGGMKAAALEMPSTSQYDLISTPFLVAKPGIYTLSFRYRAYGITGDVRPIVRCYESKDDEDYTPLYTAEGSAYGNSADWATSTVTAQWTIGAVNYCTVTLLGHSGSSTGGGRFLFDDVLFESGSFAHQASLSSSIKFHDGFNRNIQTVSADGQRDIVTQTEYDNLGRQTLATLPIGYDYSRHNGGHTYLEGVVDGSSGGHLGYFYGEPTEPFPKSQGYAFTENVYDQSPLGRLTETKLPGGLWRSGNHSRKVFYAGTNTDTPDQGTDQAPMPNNDPHYSYTLYQDEEGHLKREFRDEVGRLVKSGTKLGNRWIESDFDYDEFGNVVQFVGPQSPNDVTYAVWQYNSLGQKVFESTEDIGDHHMRYDKSGRIRFVQTLRQIDNSRFTYNKYDSFGRLIEIGEYRDGAAFNQANADNPGFPETSSPLTFPKVFNYYDVLPSGPPLCKGRSLENEDIYLVRSSPRPGEYSTLEAAYGAARTKLGALTAFNGVVAIYQFVDNPGQRISPNVGLKFAPLPLANPQVKVPVKFYGLVVGSPKYVELIGAELPVAVAWGPLKGRLVKAATCNDDFGPYDYQAYRETSQYYNYDKFGNVVETFEFNGFMAVPSVSWERTKYSYDVNNRVIEKKVFSNKNVTGDPNLQLPVIQRFTYDPLGRPDVVSDGTGAQIAEYSYNNLGQMSDVVLGQGANQIKVSYSYEFHGQVSKIEAKRISNGANLYTETLKYEDGTTPRFNGQISEELYTLATDRERIFRFQYDELNRLISADFPVQNPTVNNPSKPLNLSTYLTYYDNGAIASQKRAGASYSNPTPYVYSGQNRLTNVTERIDGRPEYSRSANRYYGNFIYDRDGRMTDDWSKDWLSIQYDVRNLPYLFTRVLGWPTFESYNAYNHEGRRISKLDYVGTEPSEFTHYFSSGKEVRGTTADFSEVYSLGDLGRLTPGPGGLAQEFLIKNHLGSTVAVYNAEIGQIVYSAEYFPMGMLAEEYVNTDRVTQKFTGKEHDNGTSLDYFGARYYDADFGVWTSPDPAMQHLSPYATASDPINTIDPNGLADYLIQEKDGSLSHLHFDPDAELGIGDQLSFIDADGNESMISPTSPSRFELFAAVEAFNNCLGDACGIDVNFSAAAGGGASAGWNFVSFRDTKEYAQYRYAGPMIGVGGGVSVSAIEGFYRPNGTGTKGDYLSWTGPFAFGQAGIGIFSIGGFRGLPSNFGSVPWGNYGYWKGFEVGLGVGAGGGAGVTNYWAIPDTYGKLGQ